MIPSNRAFNGNLFFEYEGKTFYRWYNVQKKGHYFIKIKIKSSNSPNLQGIALFFQNFKGSLKLNGEAIEVLDGFKHYVFKDGYFSDNQFVLEIFADDGALYFSNASQEHNTFHCGAFCCAFWIEEISDNHLRFHCNDHEADDDFDDLIFDMIITEDIF